ncbi:hypothetical protein [Actinomadura alba]|uniref:Uncharacterized protein n=1 Tax=Actinomadura alba TaxID=406431 RepID=A0ABR7M1G5_9ACTN|nr:hypothetical protein [Actinomadura alba]MBC6470963.1 hypothetical protein [Actinomadura alba]
MYSWTVVSGDGAGAMGITDDHGVATVRAGDALRRAPAGAFALIHKVTPSFSRIGYHYQRLVSAGHVNQANRHVVWAPVSGSTMNALPPEAFAAAVADLEAEKGRRHALGLPELRFGSEGQWA